VSPAGPVGAAGSPAPAPASPTAPVPESGIEADLRAISELHTRIRQLWPTLAEPAREDLAGHLSLLITAADHRETDTRVVRETLQTILLTIGTGALAPLSAPARHRLAALTGIALPDRGAAR